MAVLSEYVSVQYTVAIILGWPVSIIEAVGVASGLVSVAYAARMNLLTWSMGLLNAVALFVIFYQVGLYSDMMLQVFFAAATFYGWFAWAGDEKKVQRPVLLSAKSQLVSLLSVSILTVILALTMSRVHEFLPQYFPKPAAAPYSDAFTAAGSIVATILLAHKAIENWLLWIVVDVVSIWLYFTRGVPFLAALYFLYLGLASFGFYQWRRAMRDA